MNYPQLARQGARNALAAAVYILAVAGLMFNAQRLSIPEPNFLIPVFMLLLFVISALITGALVLWQPLKLLVGGQKAEAGVLLCMTGASLVACLIVVGLVLVFNS